MHLLRIVRLGRHAVTLLFSTLPLLAGPLVLREDAATESLSVFRPDASQPVLTQHAGAAARPFIHPIVAPDGRGLVTAASRGGENGLFWALTHVNGRDYLKNGGGDHWRRIATRVLIAQGEEVRWSTAYQLLGADGQPLMVETQQWTLRDTGTQYRLDLEWVGEALTDLTVGGGNDGGLFVRLAGREATVVNSARQRNERADRQRAVWLDAAMTVDGREDPVHVAIFDHPRNEGYPLPWRVDPRVGIGPTRAGLGEWKLAKGNKSVVRHQVVIYPGRLDDVALSEAWSAFSGERLDTVLWNLAREEGRRGTPLTGEQAVARMTMDPRFEVKLAAAEPMVQQPMAFCWDDRGRLWVAENRDYESRRTGFSGSGDSRIVILEDTDGDGRMDSRKVFLEGIPFPSALAWGFDGLWLGAPPNLLFVPDRNHDDRADAEIEVRLTGWGIQDRHETLNSLSWGPDGWLYGCQGYATRSNVGKPADGGRVYRRGDPFPENPAVKDPQFLDGGVWRYHPTKDRFEIVAHGFSNPWGLDFDDHGQMFITACVIPHLWHVIPGGIYHRQGGKHINPYVYDDIKTIADHRHRSAHGGARVYLADSFPAEYRGRIFMANIHERALLTDILEPRGSGFVGHHGDDVMLANDPMWVGFSLEVGPDGAVYILDWHDTDICGTTVGNKETGRIFRFAPKGLPGAPGLNLAQRSDAELVELQLHRNDWYVRRARLLLQQRAAAGRLSAGVSERLWELFERQADAGRKLRALWALHVTGSLPVERLVGLLDHSEPHVRAWAIQLLGEDRAPGARALAAFARLAQGDASPVVRLALASVLQRLAPADRWAIATGLVGHAEDATDHNLPKMIWFAVEPLVMENPPRALELAVASRLPLVTQFIARRATAGRQSEAVVAALAQAAPVGQGELLEGLRDGLVTLGRKDIVPPARWSAVEEGLRAAADPARRALLLQISQLFGDARATDAQLATLKDPAAPVERRREVLQGFARDSYAPALPVVLSLLDQPALRRDAIRALAAFDDNAIPGALLKRYGSWLPSEKAEAVLTLAARPASARQLLAALKAQTIPRREISAFAARQLQRVLGPAFVDFWGPIANRGDDRQADIAAYKRQLTDTVLASADVRNGRAVFERTCASCHTLYGSGGVIGPDLTGSNRANLDYILSEILNPSDVIQEGYQLVTITTQDGRTLAGNLAGEDDQQVTLRLIGQEMTVAKASILSREKSNVSMMPEGLLTTLSSAEVRDLIAYLRTSKQVE